MTRIRLNWTSSRVVGEPKYPPLVSPRADSSDADKDAATKGTSPAFSNVEEDVDAVLAAVSLKALEFDTGVRPSLELGSGVQQVNRRPTISLLNRSISSATIWDRLTFGSILSNRGRSEDRLGRRPSGQPVSYREWDFMPSTPPTHAHTEEEVNAKSFFVSEILTQALPKEEATAKSTFVSDIKADESAAADGKEEERSPEIVAAEPEATTRLLHVLGLDKKSVLPGLKRKSGNGSNNNNDFAPGIRRQRDSSRVRAVRVRQKRQRPWESDSDVPVSTPELSSPATAITRGKIAEDESNKRTTTVAKDASNKRTKNVETVASGEGADGRIRATARVVKSDAGNKRRRRSRAKPRDKSNTDSFPTGWEYRGLAQIAEKDASSPAEGKQCGRTDGRSWQCPLKASEGVSLCEHHQNKFRQKKLSKNSQKTKLQNSDAALIRQISDSVIKPSSVFDYETDAPAKVRRKHKTAKLSVL